ncbi:GpE family phage tail protein [Sphingobium yanoikuyae]|nr:GpE family phage tail protein [Sphingobium yanoikuyae]
MADIAVIFHWAPQHMEAMAYRDLMHWHAQAVERFKLVNG